jgi:hypothetical protein
LIPFISKGVPKEGLSDNCLLTQWIYLISRN